MEESLGEFEAAGVMSRGFGRMRVTDGGTTVSRRNPASALLAAPAAVDFENGADGFWKMEVQQSFIQFY